MHWDIIRTHGLAPWFFKSISDHPTIGIQEELKERLRKDYMLSLLSSVTSEISLKEILEALNSKGVSPVLLKGAYIGNLVYEDPALRTMCDIDLLVSEEDFELSSSVLKLLGYESEFDSGCPEDRILQLGGTFKRIGDRFTIVDLHRSLRSMDYYLVPSAEVWTHTTEKALYGNRARFLSPELNFIYMAMHALNHGPFLRDWLDLAMILNRTVFDWDKFISLSTVLGALRPRWWIFQEMSNEWESVPPVYVDNALAAYRPHWLEDRIISGRLKYLWLFYARMRLLDGWYSRIRYMKSRLMPSENYRETTVGTRKWIPYLLLISHIRSPVLKQQSIHKKRTPARPKPGAYERQHCSGLNPVMIVPPNRHRLLLRPLRSSKPFTVTGYF